jgi:predicted nucleotidyltransferase
MPRSMTTLAGAAAPSLEALLRSVVDRVVEVAKPDRIILFGSGARGDAGPDSDLDLLVVKSGVVHRRKLAQQIYRRLVGLEIPVDVVVVTPEDVEAFRGKVGTIIGPALAEGREVYVA